MRSISTDMSMDSLQNIMNERLSRTTPSSIYVIIDGSSPSVSIKDLYENDVSLYPLVPTDYTIDEECFLLPHMCEIDENGVIFNFCRNQIGNGSFILVDSKLDIMDTLRHLSKSIFAKTYKQSNKLLFRYYDPYVLEAFSMCASQEQKNILFGSIISCFWAEYLCELFDERNVIKHGIDNINVFQKIAYKDGQRPESEDLFFTHEQVGVFKSQRTLYLSDRLELFVLNKYRYDKNDMDAITPHILQAVKTMRSYGIGSIACMEKYVSCCIDHGWQFLQERPGTMRTISASGLPDNYKERVLNDLLKREETPHAS